MKRISVLALLAVPALVAACASTHPGAATHHPTRSAAPKTAPSTVSTISNYSYPPPGSKNYNGNCANFNLEALFDHNGRSVVYPLGACTGETGWAKQLKIALPVGETVQLKVPWNTGLGDYTNPASSSGAVALTQGARGLQIGLFETKESGQAVLSVKTDSCADSKTALCPVLTVVVH